MIWARENLEGSPVDITKADIGQLMRVPGIGRINAKRIVEERVKIGDQEWSGSGADGDIDEALRTVHFDPREAVGVSTRIVG